MKVKLTIIFVQAYSYLNYTQKILEINESNIRDLIGSSMYLTSNFAFSCELYLKGIKAFVSKDCSKKYLRSFKHDLLNTFLSLSEEIKFQIKNEYYNLSKIYERSHFNQDTNFDVALMQSRDSFQECRYFFDKADKSEGTFIHFNFLFLFAVAMHFWVLDHTDFNFEKTRSEVANRKQFFKKN